jgi:hypothetical protein
LVISGRVARSQKNKKAEFCNGKKDQIKAKFSKKICHNTTQKFGIS